MTSQPHPDRDPARGPRPDSSRPPTTVPLDLDAAVAAAQANIDSQLAQHAANGKPVPDPAWGIFSDGRLLAGRSTAGVYRIASMTKSFTASILLGLKHGLLPSLPDAPALDLDNPLADYIPALRADAPRESVLRRVTVRDALTMSSGMPTDDPWADRQESMDRPSFDALLRADLASVFTAGTAYAYSNLSYALLGRVIEERTGRAFADFADEAVAGFGLPSSAYSVAGLESIGAADSIVPGYRFASDGSREELPLSGPGAFSAIGGLFSTVDDIGTWMRLFLEAWEGDPHSWARIRRDMQQPVRPTFNAAPELGSQEGALDFYGYGLHHVMDPELGTMIYHSGGYPGYGSHMRWHPATGTGIVFFSNRTYGHATAIAKAAFAEFLRAGLAGAQTTGVRSLASADSSAGADTAERVRLSTDHATAAGAGTAAGATASPADGSEPELSAPGGPVHLPGDPARVPAILERWLDGFDDALVVGLFEMNMDLDTPRAERVAAIRRVLEFTGARPDPSAAQRAQWSQQRAAWSVRGPHGVRKMEITVSPLGTVQTLEVEAVPNAAGQLDQEADPEAGS